MSTVPEELSRALAPEFEILRPLGTGRFGIVYLARETALRRLVAVKVPRPELEGDAVVHRRFEREAQAAARLIHPNIAAIHRVGRLPDETPYLVMAYVKGPTLEDALKAEGPLAQETAVDVLAQLAGALAVAHAHGVVHRDVRPGNVIWQPEERRPMLTDFGIAGILETGSETVTQLTRPGQLLGDLGHTSPEQLLGEPLTPATDIYGLGVLGYEVLTLQEPYRVSSAVELASAHLRQVPRDLAELLPGVDERLAKLLARCLSKRPEHRPRAAELERRLRALSPGRVVAGDPGVAGAGGLRVVEEAMDQFPALRAFLLELMKRRVFNVAVIYLAAAFVLLQVAQAILPALPLSEWVYRAVVAITLMGFPVALVMAWLFDLTSGGVRRAEPGNQVMSRFPLRLMQGLGVILSLLIAGLMGWWLLAR
jgi:hypothetical protein